MAPGIGRTAKEGHSILPVNGKSVTAYRLFRPKLTGADALWSIENWRQTAGGERGLGET